MGERAVFKARKGKNPNFREVKREAEKRQFAAFVIDSCRNWDAVGDMSGVFARF